MNNDKQNFLQKNSFALTLIVLAAGGLWAYNSFIKVIPQSNSQPITAVGQEVISLLDRLESITLDTSIFSSPEYQKLAEFQFVIPSQLVGRPNPFAPVR